jgi:hypothetical protein
MSQTFGLRTSPALNSENGLMILTYQSGEEIKKGDSVLFHGYPAQIEVVAIERTGEATNDWYIDQYAGGIMILDGVAGRTFIPADQICDCEDLEFISRATAP